VWGSGILATFADEVKASTSYPHTRPLSFSSSQSTNLESNYACRGLLGYTHIEMKMKLWRQMTMMMTTAHLWRNNNHASAISYHVAASGLPHSANGNDCVAHRTAFVRHLYMKYDTLGIRLQPRQEVRQGRKLGGFERHLLTRRS